MKKIIPYLSAQEATQALDNGGRFYNVLTKADDGVISKSELGRVAGVFNDKQKMVLFLEMAISGLDVNAQSTIINALDADLQAIYYQHKPQVLSPSEAHAQGILSANAIVTGIPTFTGSREDFEGIYHDSHHGGVCYDFYDGAHY